MKDLLAKWADLEPGLCELRAGGSYLVGKITVDGEEAAYRVHPPFTEPHSLMRIQYAVQQAIEARDLNWAISFLVDESEPGYGGSQHTASVFTFGKRYVREGEMSAAEAILSAYLKAVEAGLKGD